MHRAVAGCAAAVAAVAALGAFGVAGASAEVCAPPHVSGFTFTALHANGIACHQAQHDAVVTMRTNRGPEGWTCSQRISGRSVSFSCHSTHGTGHSYSFSYHVH
jgi:hypothetical protein